LYIDFEYGPNYNFLEWHPTRSTMILSRSFYYDKYFTIEPDGTNLTEIPLRTDTNKNSVTISSNGHMLAFIAETSNGEYSDDFTFVTDAIQIFNLEDNTLITVLELDVPISDVQWAPDDHHLAFTWEAQDDTYNLSVINICDGTMASLAEDVDTYSPPKWQPNP
jgi:hypothetical protein